MLLQSRPSRLTHEVLTTFMAEVMAIVNNRSLVSVSMEEEEPIILTPATLLTHKSGPHPISPGEFDSKDLKGTVATSAKPHQYFLGQMAPTILPCSYERK